jgi:Mg/Co/Ni transporter MgtE
MTDIVPLGRHMRARDALAVMAHPVAVVASDGLLVGVVRRAALEGAPADTVGTLMEPATGISADDSIDAAADLAEFMDGSPAPVVDVEGRLLGGISI